MSDLNYALCLIYAETLHIESVSDAGKNHLEHNRAIQQYVEDALWNGKRPTTNQLLKVLRDSASDRPSAFYEIAERLGIKDAKELSMHAEYHPVFWSSKKVWQEERDYLKAAFASVGEPVPRLINSDWST